MTKVSLEQGEKQTNKHRGLTQQLHSKPGNVTAMRAKGIQ